MWDAMVVGTKREVTDRASRGPPCQPRTDPNRSAVAAPDCHCTPSPGPALANECVQCKAAGLVVLQLKTHRRDGTTHLVMSPPEFMQRLAALVPCPRLHLIRSHGVPAPNATLRHASMSRTPGADAKAP